MTKKALLDIQTDGLVPGLTVIGFHGRVAIDETPARLAPVYADESGCLARLVEVGPTKWTPSGQARIESFPPALAEEQPLPGEGTRTRRWRARQGSVFMAVGPEEKGRIAELRAYARKHGTRAVQRFVEWFAGAERLSSALECERQGEIALWYCTAADAFSLLDCVQRVVKDAFFQAVRAKSSAEIEEKAWWLSRAAVDDQDIYLAGAALRRVDSAAWELLIREGLHLPDKDMWTAGLAQAEWHLANPPPVPEEVEEIPPSQTRYKYRDSARKLFLPKLLVG